MKAQPYVRPTPADDDLARDLLRSLEDLLPIIHRGQLHSGAVVHPGTTCHQAVEVAAQARRRLAWRGLDLPPAPG